MFFYTNVIINNPISAVDFSRLIAKMKFNFGYAAQNPMLTFKKGTNGILT